MFSTATEPSRSMRSSRSPCSSWSPASRATSHITRSPCGSRAAPGSTARWVVPTVDVMSPTTASVRSAGTISLRCIMCAPYARRGQSLRRLSFCTLWSGPLRTTRVARPRVGATFSRRLGRLIVRHMVCAYSIASSSETCVYLRK